MTELFAVASMIINSVLLFFIVRKASRASDVIAALNAIERCVKKDEPSAIKQLTDERNKRGVK